MLEVLGDEDDDGRVVPGVLGGDDGIETGAMLGDVVDDVVGASKRAAAGSDFSGAEAAAKVDMVEDMVEVMVVELVDIVVGTAMAIALLLLTASGGDPILPELPPPEAGALPVLSNAGHVPVRGIFGGR